MTLFMTSGSVEKRQTTRICPDQGRTAESKKLLTLCCYEPQTGTRARLEVVRRLDTSGGALTGSSRTKITRLPPPAGLGSRENSAIISIVLSSRLGSPTH